MSLSVSQVLSDTFAALKSRFWPLVGMWLVFFAITIVMFVVLGMVMGGGMLALAGSMGAGSMGNAEGLGAGMIGLILVFYLVYLLLICAQNAAITALASPLRQMDFGAALGAGMRSAPTLLLVFVLFLVGYFAIALAFGIVAAVLSVLGVVGVVISVLLIVGIVLYFACRLGLVFPVVPVEGMRNPFTAIGRSWALTRGNAAPIFLAMLALVVVTALLVAILFAPLFGSISGMGSGGGPSAGAMVFLFFGGAVLSVVLAITYAAFFAALHARLAGGTDGQLIEAFT